MGEPLLQSLRAVGQIPQRPHSILLHGGYYTQQGHGLEQRLHGSCAGEPLH